MKAESPWPLRLLVRDGTLQPQVSAAGTDGDSCDSSRNLPTLGDNVPCREVEARERHRHRRGLAGGEEDAVEALEVERRALGGCRRRSVQLWDL